jgi:hypothetical protein
MRTLWTIKIIHMVRGTVRQMGAAMKIKITANVHGGPPCHLAFVVSDILSQLILNNPLK